MDPELKALGEEISHHRDCGRIHLSFEPRPPGLADARALALCAEREGFSSAPRREINRQEAERVATLILTRDLAYGSECIPEAAALEYLRRFLSAFAADARFFTNGTIDGPKLRLSNWTPITDATFDTGIFVLDETSVGFLWAEDED